MKAYLYRYPRLSRPHAVRLALLLLLLAQAAPGQSSFVVDGEEMLRQPPPAVSREPLLMAALPGETLSGENLPGCIGGTWRHRGTLTPPLLAVTLFDEQAVHDMQNLRASLQALAQHVQLESADRIYENVPTVRGPRGLYRDNVVRRSPRDIEAVRERATQSAAHLLEQFMRAPGRQLVAARADGNFVSPRLAPGTYTLCGIARVRNTEKRVGAALDLAVWWTPFTLGTNTQMRVSLDETNAINWEQIFR